jgi:hypothetical protein
MGFQQVAVERARLVLARHKVERGACKRILDIWRCKRVTTDAAQVFEQQLALANEVVAGLTFQGEFLIREAREVRCDVCRPLSGLFAVTQRFGHRRIVSQSRGIQNPVKDPGRPDAITDVGQ